MNQQKNDASLLLVLTQQNSITHALITKNPETDFKLFIDEKVKALGPDPKSIPGDWLLRIDYQNQADIPDISSPSLIMGITDSLNKNIAEIKKIMPLFDVYYCRERDRDELAPQNAHDIISHEEEFFIEEYNRGTLDLQDSRLLRGIRTDRGLLLFSDNEEGSLAMMKCLCYYGNRFFNKNREFDQYDLVTVYPLDCNHPTSGNWFAHNNLSRLNPSELPDEIFSNDRSLLELTSRKFNMLPTLENHRILMQEAGLDEMSSYSRIHDFYCLGLLHEGRCLHIRELPGEEPYEDFSYLLNFMVLMHGLDAAPNESVKNNLQTHVRELAGEILKRDFGDLQYCREPGQTQVQTQEYLPDDAPEQSTSPKLKM